MAQHNSVGQVYRCPVCGAEVSVIADGEGALAPRCCNRDMRLRPNRHDAYVCPVCGAEVMVLKESVGALTPFCCNEPMQVKQAA